MSDRRTREQHRRKFQELINYENQNVSEAIPPSSRGGNNIPSSNRGEGNNIPSSRGGGNDIPSNRSEGNNNTPISNNNTSAAEAKAIKIPPAAEAKTTPTAKAILFSAELEAKAGEGDIILGGRGRGEDNSTFSSNNDNVTLIGGSRNNFEGIRKHLEVYNL